MNTGTAADSPYAPFRSRVDWLVGRWLKTEAPSQAAANRLLDPELVQALGLSFKNCYELNHLIDNMLPCTSLNWQKTVFRLAGTEEMCEFWHRNVIEAIKMLFGDPRFTDVLHFQPEKHYVDNGGQYRLLGEMWTGNWWWRIQKRLPPGGTLVPLILGSDKTLLTQLTGDRYGYPVYMSIGNLPKDIRRAPTQHAMVLIGYLPTNKFDNLGFSEDRAKIARHRLFHQCIAHLLKDIISPGKDGVVIFSSDGIARLCFPVLGAWVADYPEQCLVTCTRFLRCPVGSINFRHMGMERTSPVQPGPALHFEMNSATHTQRGQLRSGATVAKALSLTAVQEPFFANLPHQQIHSSIYPDILHQLLQGMLKHMLIWHEDILGKRELDKCLQTLPQTNGAQHFGKGFTTLSQRTGQEFKDVTKVILGALGGSAALYDKGQSGAMVLRATRAILDFYYLATFDVHSEKTVVLLRKALLLFHSNKEGYVRLANFFCIPKLHSLVHYMSAIMEAGSLINWSTDAMEQLHKELAKLPFRESSGRQASATQEMALWVLRHEKVFKFDALIDWRLATKQMPSSPGDLSTRYLLAKKPTFPVLLLREVMDPKVWGCAAFIPALHNYACRSLGQPELTEQAAKLATVAFDRIMGWSKCTFQNRMGCALAGEPSRSHMSTAHACCARAKGGPLVKDHMARFDTVLIYDENGTRRGISAFLVGRLRLIFQLPASASLSLTGRSVTEPLAYVEWFSRPSSRAAHPSGLPIVQRLRASNGEPLASVIELKCIKRNCMLQPVAKGGTCWRSDNVLDLCDTFFLNPYLDRDSFMLLS
ncbi:hypothetical protein CALVIDRAFT_480119 [Calocera viscosa TUFC12733]|uniref:BAH domain-containing protein n=1 Tax=Calocera viscosa (strain TUFC12733) TaxID=1330018 RepID=A0A167N2T7_CALVF|nr:hypothetical protein CALVIDRAFT_480119 [Calocera viscosa TUFC12733]